MNRPENKRLISSIADGMYDWVRVLDLDDNVIFVNKAMSEALSGKTIGPKCYQAIGRDKPCDNCTTRSVIADGVPHLKEEQIGEKSFSVMCSPVKDAEGKIIAVIEVLRDITYIKKMTEKILEQNRLLRSEMDLARKIQTGLLPQEFDDGRIRFSYIYKPSSIMGGDFLGFYKPDASHMAVFIADVQGHGVPASLLTVFLHATLDKTELSPAKALTMLYEKYNNSGLDPDIYITVLLSIIDLKTLEIKYSNAGHSVSPIVFGNDRFEMLRAPGIPISNWLEKPEYYDRSFNLKSGDKIIYLTDGLLEHRNSEDLQYGEARLVDLLQKNSGNGSDILNTISESLESFSGFDNSESLSDDLTVALLEIKA